MLVRETPNRSGSSTAGDEPLGTAAVVGAIGSTTLAAAGLVALFDAILTARVRSGSDNALRLSVLLPYLGVDSTYVFARALGLTALVLAAAALVLGLDCARRQSAQKPASKVQALVHRVLGLLVVVLVAAHVIVPYLSAVGPYGGWTTALVPFAQPTSWGGGATVYESLGILALYLLILTGPGYYVLARRVRAWGVLHRFAVVAYALAVVHALFLGSDFYVAGAPRIALLAAQVPILLFLAGRLWQPGTQRRLAPLAVAALAVATSTALLVVAGLGIAGASLGGFRL